MKKVIGGKRYDTGTAKEVAYFEADYLPSDLDWWRETLYRKNTGEFFIYGEGNARTQYAKESGVNNWKSGNRIMPLTVDEAKVWAEKYLSADEYEKIFGEIEESAERKTVSFSLSESVIEQIARLAAENQISKSEVIEMMVKEKKVKEKEMKKIEIGTTYNDPDGEWEVIAQNENGTFDVKCIGGTKVESNIGFVGIVSEDEIRYFLENGF